MRGVGGGGAFDSLTTTCKHWKPAHEAGYEFQYVYLQAGDYSGDNNKSASFLPISPRTLSPADADGVRVYS